MRTGVRDRVLVMAGCNIVHAIVITPSALFEMFVVDVRVALSGSRSWGFVRIRVPSSGHDYDRLGKHLEGSVACYCTRVVLGGAETLMGWRQARCLNSAAIGA